MSQDNQLSQVSTGLITQIFNGLDVTCVLADGVQVNSSGMDWKVKENPGWLSFGFSSGFTTFENSPLSIPPEYACCTSAFVVDTATMEFAQDLFKDFDMFWQNHVKLSRSMERRDLMVLYMVHVCRSFLLNICQNRVPDMPVLAWCSAVGMKLLVSDTVSSECVQTCITDGINAIRSFAKVLKISPSSFASVGLRIEQSMHLKNTLLLDQYRVPQAGMMEGYTFLRDTSIAALGNLLEMNIQSLPLCDSMWFFNVDDGSSAISVSRSGRLIDISRRYCLEGMPIFVESKGEEVIIIDNMVSKVENTRRVVSADNPYPLGIKAMGIRTIVEDKTLRPRSSFKFWYLGPGQTGAYKIGQYELLSALVVKKHDVCHP